MKRAWINGRSFSARKKDIFPGFFRFFFREKSGKYFFFLSEKVFFSSSPVQDGVEDPIFETITSPEKSSFASWVTLSARSKN